VNRNRIFLFFILIIAAGLRFYGLDWDRGYLFHPDERQIILVASNLHFPSYPLEIFSTESPLNPKFFAYGSFPIYLLWALGRFAPAAPTFFVPWADHSLVNLLFFGRALSAAFDLGTIFFIYLLARRLYDRAVGLVAAACIAVTVLHIQLAHYYAVDTLLAFLCVATIYFATRYAQIGRTREAIWLSIAFGLALATKATAFPLIVPIVVATIKARGNEVPSFYSKAGWKIHLRARIAQVWEIRRALAKIGGVTLFTFIATQPYAVLDPIRYFGQVGTELLVARGWLDRPFTLQFADTWPFFYPVSQVSIWGIGLPLALFAWGGSAYFAWVWWRQRDWADGFILSWAIVYLFVSTAQYSKYPRYLIPLTPFLFLMAVVSIRYYAPNLSYKIIYAGGAILGVFTLVYALAFVGIYSREHPWFTISNWIYENVPPNSHIAVEHWDDTLPVPIQIGAETRNLNQYQMKTLPMYDADNEEKLGTIVNTLSTSDYVLLATQRLYGSILRAPGRYPMSARYYRSLFDGSLGFIPVEHAINAPALEGIIILPDQFNYLGLKPPFTSDAFVLNWGFEDESLSVYDHPLPLVFKKTRSLSAAELRAILK
jgi:hypothetical protein